MSRCHVHSVVNRFSCTKYEPVNHSRFLPVLYPMNIITVKHIEFSEDISHGNVLYTTIRTLFIHYSEVNLHSCNTMNNKHSNTTSRKIKRNA